jgi:hypothetical protein
VQDDDELDEITMKRLEKGSPLSSAVLATPIGISNALTDLRWCCID